MYPNGAAMVEYHSYCLPGIFLQTDPVKYLYQYVKLTLKYYHLRRSKEAIVSVELCSQTLHGLEKSLRAGLIFCHHQYPVPKHQI